MSGKVESRRQCPVCGATVRADCPICRECMSKLDRVSGKELRRSWHRVRSGQATPLHFAEFGDYCREAVRMSLAVHGAQRW